jgi:hypothetical protein
MGVVAVRLGRDEVVAGHQDIDQLHEVVLLKRTQQVVAVVNCRDGHLTRGVGKWGMGFRIEKKRRGREELGRGS